MRVYSVKRVGLGGYAGALIPNTRTSPSLAPVTILCLIWDRIRLSFSKRRLYFLTKAVSFGLPTDVVCLVPGV